MKACPACGRLYPDEAGFCPADGVRLTSVSQVPPPVDHEDSRLGRTLCDRYQIRRVVADGGMGRVYEALDLSARRNLAVKVLHPDVAQDEIAVERFKREYEVSQQLPHGYIVEVIDFQPTDDDSYALVMEFLDGEELRAMLKRTRVVPPATLVRMMSQAALALDEAHRRNFVHRDLKPDNLFLCRTADGVTAKILDFGSVKAKASARKLTVMGTTIGSPYYMPPEQAQGLDTLDQRADVWAMGTIIYECLTGQVPFKGANAPSILLEILQKEPEPPSQVVGDGPYPVPASVDRVLVHALKKSPGVRIAGVGKLADALGHAYGLTGDHAEWATTPEVELARRIEAGLPEVLAAPVRERDLVDDFFGEAEALGTFSSPVSRPVPSAPEVVVPGHLAPGLSAPALADQTDAQRGPAVIRSDPFAGELPGGVPTKSALVWFVPFAVGAALVLLIAAALLYALL